MKAPKFFIVAICFSMLTSCSFSKRVFSKLERNDYRMNNFSKCAANDSRGYFYKQGTGYKYKQDGNQKAFTKRNPRTW